MKKEQCLVLVEATTEGLIDEIGKEVLDMMSTDELEVKLISTVGKPEAFGAYTDCLGQFDLILTEATPEELALERSSVGRYCRDFEKKTRDIPTLQFAYQIKEVQPFTNIVVIMDFSKFSEGCLYRFMMQATKIGVETFLDIPNGNPKLLQDLLQTMQQKIIYERNMIFPIREIVETFDIHDEGGDE